jgi:hypothetical protein
MSACMAKELSMKQHSLEIIGGSETKEFLRTEIMRNMESIDWSSNADSRIIITPSEMRTHYESIDDADFVRRTCLLRMEIRLETVNSSRIVQCPRFEFSDTVEIAQIPAVEIPSYTFCKGIIPKQESTIFDGIVKPVIYVLTFGFSAYLLFGVRSSD